MITTEYKEVYGLRNKETKKMVLTYFASSSKHKALFATMKNAMDANEKWLDGNCEVITIK